MSRPWLPLAFLGLLGAELAAFLTVGYLIGFGWTVLLILALSLAGLVLLRREGLRAWRRFRAAAVERTPPGPRLTDGLVGLGGALLLAAPGLVTGVAGAVLLIPPVRLLARRRMQARAERWMTSAQAGQMFGPRRVRVQTTGPERPETDLAGASDTDTEPAASGSGSAGGGPTEVVEGEIVDPRDYRP